MDACMHDREVFLLGGELLLFYEKIPPSPSSIADVAASRRKE